jgi:hypothetical protein
MDPAIKRALEDFHFKPGKPAAKLAQLAKLEALPPAVKKQLKTKPGAPALRFESERVRLHLQLGIEEFVKADAEYWQHRDASAVPDQFEGGDASASVEAALRRASRMGPPRASKRATKTDFTRAREALMYVVAQGKEPGYLEEAQQVLASIALREAKPREAIKWCKSIERHHAAPRMAWAFEQLGDQKQTAAWLAQGSPTHRALRAELVGDDDTAIRTYLESIATRASRWQAYAKLRLRKMEARLGKAAIARVKKALAEAKKGDAKITIASIDDFHTRFADIAAAIRKKRGITQKPTPMSDAAIAKLHLPTSRRSAKPTVPVPKSVRTILRTDKNFCLWKNATPLLAAMKPVDVEKLVRKALRGEDTGLGPLARLPASVPVWTEAPQMPACIWLANAGDQELFLYMGVADADGEYPVARFDDQPELWISDASLVHYILGAAKDVVRCKIDLEKAKKAAQKRNARYREGWSAHPKVRAVLAKF